MGRPPGKKLPESMHVRLPHELLERAHRVAELEGVKLAETIRRALLRYCSDVEANRNQLPLPLEGSAR